eukprot:309352-Prorocentrum_minimum.AAC.2
MTLTASRTRKLAAALVSSAKALLHCTESTHACTAEVGQVWLVRLREVMCVAPACSSHPLTIPPRAPCPP